MNICPGPWVKVASNFTPFVFASLVQVLPMDAIEGDELITAVLLAPGQFRQQGRGGVGV